MMGRAELTYWGQAIANVCNTTFNQYRQVYHDAETNTFGKVGNINWLERLPKAATAAHVNEWWRNDWRHRREEY